MVVYSYMEIIGLPREGSRISAAYLPQGRCRTPRKRQVDDLAQPLASAELLPGLWLKDGETAADGLSCVNIVGMPFPSALDGVEIELLGGREAALAPRGGWNALKAPCLSGGDAGKPETSCFGM